WIDPLGLNTCPDENGCKPSASVQNPTASVSHGEPALPQLPRSQRQARIDELAEANAYRRLDELEKATPGAHFLEKHGKQTTLASQLERLQTAKNPTTGIIEYFTSGRRTGEPKYPPAATHFLSHRDQLNAIYRAQLIFRRSGHAQSMEPIHMGKIIGEGYSGTEMQYSQQSKARVILNRDGKPKTAYTEL
ncbi:type IV secretion protein Rhs, partial [Pseudomonas synxantha]